jgi:hypothetical protein
MKTVLKWASWLVSAVAIYLMVVGSFAYLFGNISIFGVKWGTYYIFAWYYMTLAILLVLLNMACKENCKE